MAEMTREELQALYAWVDEIPLSRQKKNISRDFSDGVLVAEVIGHFLPKMVDMHNYSPANSTPQKLDNWRTLNRKVLSCLNFQLPDDVIQSAVASKPGVIEFVLSTLRIKIERHLENRAAVREAATNGHDSFVPDDLGKPYPAAPYNPNEFISNYGNTGALVLHNSQDSSRHPLIHERSYPTHFQPQNHSSFTAGSHSLQQHLGPHHQQHLDPHHLQHLGPPQHSANNTTTPAHTYHQPTHTKPNASSLVSRIPRPAHHLLRQGPESSSQPAPSFPPINTGPITMTTTRGHTYPDKQPPKLNRRNAYGAKPAKPALTPQQRDSIAGMKIRLAEKDQKLLESQEYTQLLHMKVTRLEHLAQIKDMKIAELSRQLEIQAKHSLYKR